MSNRINSRTKGNKAERIAAKLLETWTKKTFSRTPSSGGLQWHKRSSISGDVVCTTEGHYFPFSVEVKAHKEINFQNLIYGNKSKLLEFWEQAKNDAAKANKEPLLLVRYNGLPKTLFFGVIKIQLFEKYFNNQAVKEDWARLLDMKHHIAIIPSNDLFKLQYKPIRKALRNEQKKKTKK